METLPVRVPHTLFPDLVSAFIPPDTPPDAELELVIIIEGENIPAREFAEYLTLIDRIYGRLSYENLRSYSRRQWGRLKIAEIHKSDLEIIFRTLYSHTDTATYIITLLVLRSLIVKSLPHIVKFSTEGTKAISEAYKAYQEAKAIGEDTRHKEIMNRYEEDRLARKQIREMLQRERAVELLDRTRKSQLTELLDALVKAEVKHLPAPIRFAHRQVKDVILRVRPPQKEPQSNFELKEPE